MIDLTKLEWGLRPFRELEALAVYGARTIFRDGNIEFLQDRQSCIGEEDACKILCAWINHKALPALKEHIRKHDWTPMTQETFTLETWSFLFEASPRASGYIYITAYLKGLSEFPTGKWSGNFIPKIGETIFAVVNDIGKCQILGYYLEDGWIGVIAKPAQPPEWFVRQNGENAVCGLFGTEIRKLESEHQKGDNE